MLVNFFFKLTENFFSKKKTNQDRLILLKKMAFYQPSVNKADQRF